MFNFGNKNLKILNFLLLSFLLVGTHYIHPTKKELSLKFGKNLSGELSVSFLQYLKDLFNIHTFIETGTYVGMTARHAAQVFEQIETIELSKQFYEAAKVALSSYTNLTIYHGDSAKLLDTMIRASKGNMLFWLDGHYSANGSALGEINTPILQELQIIKNAGINNAVILIDDIRLFDKYVNKLPQLDLGGYPTLPEISKKILDINPDYDIVTMGDILMAYVKSDDIVVSDVLKACSKTRVKDDLSIEELEKARVVIGNATGTELETIRILYEVYCTQENFIKYGVGAHYALWFIFHLIENKSFEDAIRLLNGSIGLDMDPAYISSLVTQIRRLPRNDNSSLIS